MKTIFARLILTTAAISAITISLIGMFYVLPAQEKLLKRNLVEKAKAISTLYSSSLSKAIASNDDISLLIQIDNMMKLEDVSQVFVVDSTGKVLLHNKSSEWGKTYDSEIIKKCIETKKQRMVPATQTGGFLYSAPLTSSSTLCVGLSSQKNDSIYSVAKITVALISGLAVVLICIMLMISLNNEVRKPLKQLKELLESMAITNSGKAQLKGPHEFEEIVDLINKIADHAPANSSTTESDIKPLLVATCNAITQGMIVIDSNNRLLCINSLATQALDISDKLLGKHILDVFKAGILLEALHTAQNSDMPQQFTYNNHQLTISSIHPNTTLCGTIITIKK